MSKSYKSFSQLKDALFDRFIEMNAKDRTAFLLDHGIDLDCEYVGVYDASKNIVKIDSLANPFNGKKIEGKTVGNVSFPDKQRIAVKVIVGRVKGEGRSPDNVFGIQCNGIVVDKDLLQKELKKKSSKEKELEVKNKAQSSQIRQLKQENAELQKIVRDKQQERAYEKILTSNNELRERIKTLEKASKENAMLKHRVSDQDDYIKKLLDEGNSMRKEFATFKTQVSSSNKEKLSIFGTIRERDINELLHVTQINNLPSVLEQGILPINLVPKGAAINDKDRYDRRPDCTSLSISRINSWYFQDVHEKNETAVFVCIYIDPIILVDDCIKYYCPHNAATYSIRKQTEKGELTSSEDFINMFADTIRYIKSLEGPKSQKRRMGLRDNYPTSEQAEILYRGVISPTNIMGIGFPNEQLLAKYQPLLKRYNLKGRVDHSINF